MNIPPISSTETVQPDGSLWTAGAFRLTAEQIQNVPTFRRWLRTIDNELGRYIADISSNTPARTFDRKDVSELETLIARNSDPVGACLFFGRMLQVVVRELNRRGKGPIPRPALLAALRREPHPCPDGFIDEHNRVAAWSEAACDWVRRLCGQRLNNVPVGLIALAAILWGRVLHTDTLLAIVAACAEPEERFRWSNGAIYTDLSLRWGGMADQEIQRWYADEGLACLISRVSTDSVLRVLPQTTDGDDKAEAAERKKSLRALHQEIVDEFHRQSMDDSLVPSSLQQMIEAVDRTLITYVPAVFRRFWKREIHARTLSPECIGRIYGEESLVGDLAEEAEQNAPQDQIPEPIPEACGDDASDDEPPTWLTGLQKAFSTKQEEEVLARLKQLGSSLGEEEDPIAKQVIAFAVRLVERGSLTTGMKWGLNTMRNCVLTVARRLGLAVGDCDLAVVEPVVLEAKYLEVIDLAVESKDPNRLQHSVAMSLREFHRFLMCFYRERAGSGGIDESTVFRTYRGLFAVHATVISLDDLCEIVAKIGSETELTDNDTVREAAQVMVIVAFLIGSRRMENFWLRDVDFPGGSILPVIIRPWGEHHLKTPNATRVDPLGVFLALPDSLPEDLVRRATDWLRRHRRGGESYFFRLAKDDKEHVSVDVLIPIIHKALRAVGGPGAHMHTLRHSAATWTFARLILSDMKKIPNIFGHLPCTNRWIRETSKEFRLRLFGNDTVSNDHAWAISTLLGQSFPGVPLENYIHCMDRLSPLVLRESGYLRDTSYSNVIEYSTGLARSTRSDKLHRQTADYDTALARTIEEVVTERIKRARADAPPPVPRRSWIEASHELLRLQATSALSVYDMASAVGFTPDLANRVLDRSSELARTDGRPLWPELQEEASEKKKCWIPTLPSEKFRPAYLALAAAIEQSARNNSDATSRILAFYASDRDVDSAEVRFFRQDSQQVKPYCDFVGRLGIRRARLVFTLWGIAEKSEAGEFWQKVIGRHPIEYRACSRSGRHSTPCLTIEPRFAQAANTDPWQSPAVFRFALDMAAIRFSYP